MSVRCVCMSIYIIYTSTAAHPCSARFLIAVVGVQLKYNARGGMDAFDRIDFPAIFRAISSFETKVCVCMCVCVFCELIVVH